MAANILTATRRGGNRPDQNPETTSGLLDPAKGLRREAPLLLQPSEQCAGQVVSTQRVIAMATNRPRHGYERKRSQLKTKTMGQKHWTKRSRKTGEFMDQKKAGKFKSVRREKSAR